MGPEKLWQDGPAYMRQPREELPIKDKVGGTLPKEELQTRRLDLWGSSASSCSRSVTTKPSEAGQEEAVPSPKAHILAAALQAPEHSSGLRPP